MREFSGIEFRASGAERHACLRGALPVWQVILVGQELDLSAERIAQYFEWPVPRAQAALDYYEAYPAEVDRAIANNRDVTFTRLRRLLPQAEVRTVTEGGPEARVNG